MTVAEQYLPLLFHAAIPEGDDDGGGLGARCDERDDEQEDEEGDEGAAGAVALPRYRVAVLVQVGLDYDELQLVGALPTGRRRDDLPALDAGTVRVVTKLEDRWRHTTMCDILLLYLLLVLDLPGSYPVAIVGHAAAASQAGVEVRDAIRATNRSVLMDFTAAVHITASG